VNTLRVLLTNRALSERTGTEIVVRDLALGLLRLGHLPFVYAHEVGAFAAELRAASIPVVDDIEAIGTTPDVIHGHHNSALAAAVARFPDVPAIFVCHDFTAWHDAPPIFPSIRRYVAVDRTVADRLVIESGISPDRVAVHLNAVDLERFEAPNRQLPPRPLRALAYVKHLAHVDALRAACSARGISLDVAGTVAGKALAAPERVLRNYDLVFTSALAALESMASGCGVVVCDARGLAGFVTPDAFERWRPYNFGLRTLTRKVTAEAIAEQIDRYDASAAAVVTTMVRSTADLRDLVQRYVELYEACIAEGAGGDRLVHDRAVARHLERWVPRYAAGWPWMIERDHLMRQRDTALERPPRLRDGDDVPLGAGSPPVVEFAGGFSRAEDWGVWTDGDEAVLAVRVDVARTPEIEIALFVEAFVRPENTPLKVRVRANGMPVASWSFSDPHGPTWQRVRVPMTADSDLVVLVFAIETPLSPKELGLSDDSRRLGLGLHRLAVSADDSADDATV
jgi:glycosyl transferase family 4/uncharacterized protein DUF7024